MNDLIACSTCHRHVAIDESTCPFCGVGLGRREPRPPVHGRLSRAAFFASATLATAACSSRSKPEAGGSAQPVTQRVDATSIDAAPVPDAMVVDAAVVDAAPPDAPLDAGVRRRPRVDAGVPEPRPIDRPPNNMPYGAPPVRRRVV